MTEEQLLLKHERMGMDCFIAAAVVAGVVGVGSSIASGVESSNAAGAQANAANHAADLQQQEYQQTRQDQMPYMQAGTTALGQIQQQQSTGTGFAAPFNFTADPGYSFTRDQGMNAINSSAAATGGVLNGGTLKALDQYTTGLANQTYGDAYSRYLANSSQKYGQLMSLAQLGEGATATTGAQGVQSAANQGNFLTQAGNATAAGDVGVGNAISGGLSSLGTLGYSAYQGSQSSYGKVPTLGGLVSNAGSYTGNYGLGDG